MSYTVVVLPQAEDDADRIYRYICRRSPQGAAAWFGAFLDALDKLRETPGQFSSAPEAPVVGHEVRQILFKTRRGRAYRALYTIQGHVVHVLHVRGPGQRPIRDALN